jgi:hypothetical protein
VEESEEKEGTDKKKEGRKERKKKDRYLLQLKLPSPHFVDRPLLSRPHPPS